jgi:MFS family permease
VTAPSTGGPGATVHGSAWAPLRVVAFRALWLAQLGSMIGTWMQTVGAQWLLVDRPDASTLVALVQTASMLPVLLFALPAGVIADSFDRRRLLVAVQAATFVIAAALTGLTVFGQMPPALLLTFTFLLGCGAALTMPAWQALIPELVPRAELPAASALGAISINVARAVGPALAGVLVARASVAVVFAINAISYVVLAAVLARWGPPTAVSGDVPERFTPALRAGARYIRHSPVERRILLRSGLFVLPGTSLWALLPLVASGRLELGAGGYGLLLAALGIGAVGGAVGLPRLRARMSTSQMLVVASVVYAGALVVLASSRNGWLVAAVLVPAGAAWLAVLSSLSAAMQMFLPGWVRARGLSVHQVVFLGGQGIAALLWGLLAQYRGLVVTFVVAAVLMALGAATTVGWPLLDAGGVDRGPAAYWPEPRLAFEPDPDTGPVLVTLTFTVAPERVPEFLDAMTRVRRSRQRTGATRWALYRDGEDPRRFVEAYLVPSWEEHLRQHSGRLTGADQALEEEAVALAEASPEVAHLFPASRAG